MNFGPNVGYELYWRIHEIRCTFVHSFADGICSYHLLVYIVSYLGPISPDFLQFTVNDISMKKLPLSIILRVNQDVKSLVILDLNV